MLIYVTMNINYHQTISKGGLQKVISILAWVQLAGQIVVTSWNSLSFPGISAEGDFTGLEKETGIINHSGDLQDGRKLMYIEI